MVPNGGWFSMTDFTTSFQRRPRGRIAQSRSHDHPASAESDGACLMTYGLFQIRDKLVYRYGGTSTELCTLPIGQTSHVIVTYSPGHLGLLSERNRVFLTDKCGWD